MSAPVILEHDHECRYDSRSELPNELRDAEADWQCPECGSRWRLRAEFCKLGNYAYRWSGRRVTHSSRKWRRTDRRERQALIPAPTEETR